MPPDAERIEFSLSALEAILLREDGWRADFLASRATFFAVEPSELDAPSKRRHLEWYLFERSRPGDARLAIDALVEEHAVEVGLDALGLVQSLRNSHVGVFEVASVTPGSGLWVADLASGGQFALEDLEASHVLAVGDVLAGRIFALADGAHHASPGSAFVRNAPLRDALRADMAQARASRRGVVRISQREIEAMFFGLVAGPADPVALRNPLESARALLLAGGASADDVERWFAELAVEEFEPATLLPGKEDVLGDILDQIAFETDVELEAARRALLLAWKTMWERGVGQGPSLTPQAGPAREAHASPLPTPGQPQRAAAVQVDAPVGAAPDVASALAEFERKQKGGAAIDDLFRGLERDLALEVDGEPDPDAEELAPAPDFPGVVGAMVEEFAWESEVHKHATNVDAEPLRAFGRFAGDVGVFENLSRREILRYVCWWALEHDEVRNADEARALLAALSAFCRWSEHEHELPLHSALHATFATLHSSLPRIAEANRRRTRVADMAAGELFECVAVEAGRVKLLSRSRHAHEAELDTALTEWLRAGDRVRGRLHEDGRLAVYCCFPPESRELTSA